MGPTASSITIYKTIVFDIRQAINDISALEKYFTIIVM